MVYKEGVAHEICNVCHIIFST